MFNVDQIYRLIVAAEETERERVVYELTETALAGAGVTADAAGGVIYGPFEFDRLILPVKGMPGRFDSVRVLRPRGLDAWLTRYAVESQVREQLAGA